MGEGLGVRGIGEGVEIDDGTPLFDDEAPDPAIDLVALEHEPEPESKPELYQEPEPEPAGRPNVFAPVFIEAEGGQLAIAVGDDPPAHQGPWKLPPGTILKRGSNKRVDQRVAEEGGRVLEATLAQHGVDARLIGMTIGPSVTQYALELGPGVKVNRVTGLQPRHPVRDGVARRAHPRPHPRVAARSASRCRTRSGSWSRWATCSPRPRSATRPQPTLAVGPRPRHRGPVGDARRHHVAARAHRRRDRRGEVELHQLARHVVADALHARPGAPDPRRPQARRARRLQRPPHLLTEVVTNPKKAANALDWAVREMDMRYELLAEVGVRDITGYNAMFDRGELPTKDEPDPITGKGYERLPFIVIVVDELNDLMMVAARDVEASICRIAQMARAVGIHLVIATQRPSVDVITGVIKANMPSRLAFSVSSLADSRVILDQAGAEKLIGKGDMLLITASSSRAQRIQGSWVDEECVRKVVAHWRRQATTLPTSRASPGTTPGGGAATADDGDGDDLLAEAMELVVRSGLGSTSMLQRKLRVGFARAGRLMDLLERRGVVGPSEGSKARAVLMTVDEFEAATGS